MDILIVHDDFYRGTDIQEGLREDGNTVEAAYRDYIAKGFLEEKPYDLVIGNGRCKTRGDSGHDDSYGIYFSARKLAHQFDTAYMPELHLPVPVIRFAVNALARFIKKEDI